MASRFRDVKLRARKALHGELSLPAFYYPNGDPNETPQDINVRVHSKWEALGDLAGTSYQYAETREEVPKIVFDIREVASPLRNAVVAVLGDEAYSVDAHDPPDDFTVTASAVRLGTTEAQSYAFPEEA